MERHTTQPARRLSDHVIEGLEKRLTAGKQSGSQLQEIYELRAIGREVIGHINHTEAALERLRQPQAEPFITTGGRT